MQPDATPRSTQSAIVYVRIVQWQSANPVQLFELFVIQSAGDVINAQWRAQVTFLLFVETCSSNGCIKAANRLQSGGLMLEDIDP